MDTAIHDITSQQTTMPFPLALTTFLTETVATLKGSERRMFMARTVRMLGRGGQRKVARELGWDRKTIRKGEYELAHGAFHDQYSKRGRKKAEDLLPSLLRDIRQIVEPDSQTDPTFETCHRYRRISAPSVREQLLEEYGYSEAECPQERTIRTKLNELDFRTRRVVKSKPQKKNPETDAIFAQLHKVNHFADRTEGYVRLSLDAKATIKVGPYSRGGLSRRRVAACDHDFAPDLVLKLFGIFLPAYDRLWFFFTEGAVSPDFMVDQMLWLWPEIRREYHPHTLVLNMDNGPDTNSHRTQLIKRLVVFARSQYVSLELAYYPPYHSKYNAIERVWGILENHWNGELLDSQKKVLGLAQDMRWKGRHPIVRFIPKLYPTGVALTPSEMAVYEQTICRMPGLERWFVWIPCIELEQARYC